MKTTRSLAASALQAAHRVADGALEVQLLPALALAGQAGTQVADAGISALAHLACAATAVSHPGSRTPVSPSRSFAEAAKHLEQLRTVLKACENGGLVGRLELAPLYYVIDETLGLLREAEAGLDEWHSDAA